MKFFPKKILKNIEQEVFLDAIRLYADLATENSNIKVKKKKLKY